MKEQSRRVCLCGKYPAFIKTVGPPCAGDSIHACSLCWYYVGGLGPLEAAYKEAGK